MRSLWWLTACSLAASACGRTPASAADQPHPVPAATTISEAAEAKFVDAGNWAAHVGPMLDQPARAAAALTPAAAAVHAAVMSDDSEDSDEPVLTGRLVYRVRFGVPPSFRDRRANVIAPAGELHVDISRTRLRARFVGPGWPVPEGSELRLRADLPGIYLFDSAGGRSLGAGQLAAWFEGQGSAKPLITFAAILRDWGKHAAGPLSGDMICALLAEWSNERREALAYRCHDDSLPPGFRIGPWSAELTAVVPLSVPRRNLRADDADPPRLPPRRPPGSMLEASAIAGLVPSRALPGPPDAKLVVSNLSPTRVLMIAQGVPLGWVDAGDTLTVGGFAPGFYRIGGVRPLGILRMPPKLIRIPGEITLGHTDPELEEHLPAVDAGVAGVATAHSSSVQPEPVPADPQAAVPPDPQAAGAAPTL
jgi:hypothetical protein